MRKCLFPMGQVLVTPGALDLLQGDIDLAMLLLTRHQGGDFGDLDEHDRNLNVEAIRLGGRRVFSAYQLPAAGKLWVITEADRASTTMLTPDEY